MNAFWARSTQRPFRIGLPELNGLEATRQILKIQPNMMVQIYTMHETEKLSSTYWMLECTALS